MARSNSNRSRWILGIIVVAAVGVLVVMMGLFGAPKEDGPAAAAGSDSPDDSGAAPAITDEVRGDTKTDRDSPSGAPARDQSFRPRLEMSRKIKAVAVEATRELGEYKKQLPRAKDDPVAMAELDRRLAATTDPHERAALTREFFEAGRKAHQEAEAARTPEMLRHRTRLVSISRLESFLDLPAYISEGTEFSAEAETLLVKVTDFAERSAQMDAEAVIAEFETLNAAIRDLRRRRTGTMPSLLDHGDD